VVNLLQQGAESFLPSHPQPLHSWLSQNKLKLSQWGLGHSLNWNRLLYISSHKSPSGDTRLQTPYDQTAVLGLLGAASC